VSTLTRKLLREVWHLRGQALAIAVVIAGGVATLVMSLSSLDSLTLTRDAYYRDFRFAHVFASLKRAPESLRASIEAIPGCSRSKPAWWRRRISTSPDSPIPPPG
jgi:putative ABC transport system permease protein